MLNVAPSILAPKGCSARTKIGAAFTQYFENYIPGRTQSSAMTLSRYTVSTRHGISLRNQGLLEVGTLIGILANTIPSLFYMLVRIYADQKLLQNIRDELESTAVENCSEKSKRVLMILSMREKCPLLHSTFQELLRFHAKGANARYVREDTMLDDQYLLKKGMIVHMPMAVMHFDPTIWGPDATEFKAERFLKKKSDDPSKLNLNLKPPNPNGKAHLQPKSSASGSGGGEEKKDPKQTLTAYRPFGGGASLCPGRHFVTLEALALTAIMVLRYDIEPADNNVNSVNDKREWIIPPQKQESLATNVFPPAHDIRVTIKRRKGMEDVNWEFFMA